MGSVIQRIYQTLAVEIQRMESQSLRLSLRFEYDVDGGLAVK
jgi:hypothetical protein